MKRTKPPGGPAGERVRRFIASWWLGVLKRQKPKLAKRYQTLFDEKRGLLSNQEIDEIRNSCDLGGSL